MKGSSSISRITQKDIARVLKISRATVSRGLARSPLLPGETVQKIVQTAERLGYRPDAALASLNAYRNSRRKPSQQQHLAWVTHHRADSSLKLWARYDRQLFEGAKLRASELGYNLEIVSVKETSVESSKALKVLDYRKIEGIVFAPRAKGLEHLRVPLDHFSSVTVGYSLYFPQLDIVAHSHTYAMTTVYRKLYAAGYRRIGLLFNPQSDSRSDGLWRGGYYLHQSLKASRVHIPVLEIEEIDKKPLIAWIKRWKPDAIITHIERMEQLFDALGGAGIKVPDDIGVACLSIPQDNGMYTGINERVVELGKLSVDVVVSKIRNHDRGVPKLRTRHLLDGEWREGATIRGVAR